MEDEATYTAFATTKLVVARGDLATMLAKVKQKAERSPAERILIFEDSSGRQVDFDLRGSVDEVVSRARPAPRAGAGRPKLGVVSREVSLLPRHWEWLERQPQGASAALRRLIDEARKRAPGKERARLVREAAGRVMWSLAGDFPHFEEATRALYAGDLARLESLVAKWPKAVREHLLGLARDADRHEAEPEPAA